MQLYGDPGVFVPDESDASARHWDYDVESHSVRGVKRICLQSPAVMVVSGHLHVAQCQGDWALLGQHRYKSWYKTIFVQQRID